MSATDDVVGRFWELTQEADRVDSTELETDIEPWLEAVLSHVLRHPEAKGQFVKSFMDLLREDRGPTELVEYCMHALRWPEVKAEVAAWLESEKSERVRHALRGVLRAFDDDWHVASSYARFSSAAR